MKQNINYFIQNIGFLSDKILNLPHEIKIELTYKCNKNCDFCFNKNSIDKKEKELSTLELKKLIDSIKNNKIKRIRFTGGEPTLREDLIELIKYSKKKGLIIKLNTNLETDDLNKINELAKNIDEILVSIHSTDVSEDYLKKLNNKLNVFRKNEVDINISTIATKENIIKFDEFSNILKKISPENWFWNYPIPHDKELITWNEIKKLEQKIKNSKLNFKCYGIRFPLCNVDKNSKSITGCKNCGPFDHLVVNPYGKIHLCNSFNFELGDIKTNNILDVWRTNKLVNSLKKSENIPIECKTCSKLKTCKGGCRYSAYIQTGKINGKHPLCENPLK